MSPRYRIPSILLVAILAVVGALSACSDDSTSPLAGGGDAFQEPFDDPADDPGTTVADCDSCRGEVTTLVLRYTGSVSNAHVVVVQHCPDVVIFDEIVQPQGEFYLEGADANKTMGQQLSIYINDDFNGAYHVSCSDPIGPGMVRGDFIIVEGTSKAGGTLCPFDGSL